MEFAATPVFPQAPQYEFEQGQLARFVPGLLQNQFTRPASNVSPT